MVFWPQAFFKSMKFESPADAGLSNRSNGAEAPAAAFGKTASADFAINMDVGQKRSGHAITFDLTSLQYWKTRNAVFLRREGLTDSWNGQTQ